MKTIKKQESKTDALTNPPSRPSLPEVHRSIRVPKQKLLTQDARLRGPGYLVSVGYMDPGNWATDIAGGLSLAMRS